MPRTAGPFVALVLAAAVQAESHPVIARIQAAWRQQDYAQALRLTQPLAQAGDPEAQQLLAGFYRRGEGVPASPARALLWMRKAAAAGYGPAQKALGDYHLDGVGGRADRAMAFQWWKRSAEAGDPDGLYQLGVAYAKGLGTPKDPGQAELYLRRARDQGNRRAGAYLKQIERDAVRTSLPPSPAAQAHVDWKEALRLREGLDLLEFSAEAHERMTKAADAGHADAQHWLGHSYRNGFHGVAQDTEKALHYYGLAAAQGHTSAKHAQGEISWKRMATEPSRLEGGSGGSASVFSNPWSGRRRGASPGQATGSRPRSQSRSQKAAALENYRRYLNKAVRGGTSTGFDPTRRY